MYNNSLAYDVANDISIRMLEYDNLKLNRLHERNEFYRYLYRILRNESINPNSPTNKLYKPQSEIKNDVTDDDVSVDLLSLVSILTPYELKLLTIYSETKNIVSISKKYNIRRSTIHKEIKEIKLKIKQSIK